MNNVELSIYINRNGQRVAVVRKGEIGKFKEVSKPIILTHNEIDVIKSIVSLAFGVKDA